MSKHTSGPWVVFDIDEHDGTLIGVTSRTAEHIDSDGDGADICSMENYGYFGFTQVRANARLISAAPELLEALETLTEFCHRYCAESSGKSLYVNNARAAIAKAAGETS